MARGAGHECYHCKQWLEAGEAHDCWTTTEAALTGDLPEDLREAYVRLRDTAADFGGQRIYASHNSIMFARKTCYFFVRPKRSFLEVCIFLPRTIQAPQIRRATPASRTKVAHTLRVTHRDEVEAPLTDWLREAYHLQDTVISPKPDVTSATSAASAAKAQTRPKPGTKPKPRSAKARRAR